MPDSNALPSVCPYAGRCGGCSLQNTPYERQIADKRDLLTRIMQKALDGAGRVAPLPPVTVVPSPPFEYRSRIELHRLPEAPPARRVKKVTAASAGLPPPRAGFMARGGAELIPVSDCPVAVPVIRDALRRGLLTPPPDKNRWAVFGAEELLLGCGGKNRGAVRLLDKTFTVDTGVFFQSNLILLERLIEDIQRLAARLDSAGEAWDLYGGAGTFAVFLLPYFSRVMLMEADRAACSLARENIHRNAPARSGDVLVYALDDRAWAGELGKKRRAGKPVFVCADPPREGLSPEASRFLAESGAKTVVYISCNPRSLARDARPLLGSGYNLEALTLYDFYPQTEHIESLAVWSL